MNLRLALLLGCALVLPALRAADADAGSFTQNRARIDALFLGRDAAPVLPADIVNPFSRPEERALANPSGNPGFAFARPQTLSNHELLERVAPAIQVRGIVQATGRPSVIINRKLFGEGDTLTVLYGETTVEVVIKRIGDDTFTLGYKDAELTLRLPR